MLSSVEKSKKNPTKHGPQSQIVHKKVPVSKKAGKEKYKTNKAISQHCEAPHYLPSPPSGLNVGQSCKSPAAAKNQTLK